MLTVSILEPHDTVLPTDWMRPYDRHDGMDDQTHSLSPYGTPSNHGRWVRVSDVLGDPWWGQTVKRITKGVEREYEFMRANPLPRRMVWDWRAARDRH